MDVFIVFASVLRSDSFKTLQICHCAFKASTVEPFPLLYLYVTLLVNLVTVIKHLQSVNYGRPME